VAILYLLSVMMLLLDINTAFGTKYAINFLRFCLQIGSYPQWSRLSSTGFYYKGIKNADAQLCNRQLPEIATCFKKRMILNRQ
jgi:hypothetical protein